MPTPEFETLSAVTQIVSAYLSHNAVEKTAIPDLIKSVRESLLAAEAPETQEPSVDLKKSVFPDHIVCLECGQEMRMLRRHLKAEHNLTPEQYRIKWNLPYSYPLVAPNHAQVRAQIAKDMGLGTARTRKKK